MTTPAIALAQLWRWAACDPFAPGSPRHLMPCLAKPDVSWLSLSFGPSSIPIDYYGLC